MVSRPIFQTTPGYAAALYHALELIRMRSLFVLDKAAFYVYDAAYRPKLQTGAGLTVDNTLEWPG